MNCTSVIWVQRLVEASIQLLGETQSGWHGDWHQCAVCLYVSVNLVRMQKSIKEWDSWMDDIKTAFGMGSTAIEFLSGQQKILLQESRFGMENILNIVYPTKSKGAGSRKGKPTMEDGLHTEVKDFFDQFSRC